MLQIRLRRDTTAEIGGGARPSPAETVTVACPDHLVLADLPVAKGIGSVTPTTVIKLVGRRSRRQLGERVHFCVRCDFPIAIYGRLSPCEHAFCLECARSDSICYLCDERIQKIQTIKMMEGIFICAAPHCLKSFLKKADFESHIHAFHGDLLQPNSEKDDGNESDVQSTKQSSASESTLRGPVRPQQLSREQPPHRQPKAQPGFGQASNYLAESPADNSRPPGFETAGSKPGILPGNQFPEYPPMHSMQPLNQPMPPMNQNQVLPQPFGFPPYPTDGGQPFYGGPYEMPRTESGSDQGSLLVYPPIAPMVNPNFPGPYPPQTWNHGMPGLHFDATAGGQGQGSQGGRNNLEGKGILPPPPPAQVAQQLNRGQFYQGDTGRTT
ncbi:PREDICTED: E3 ubiquitin-protein ligase Hakai [Tarenaya hassleriana]|uniref:E3 ubiquitin-protein ligase Hakai n=1 Tax=Tarenaya hassleriana TaxID=28532 RepID=UPI00053C87CB|nr:PREDICTED: E3 ubiquitin-protein ligase Hakai [Tarenaya hassleriana]